MRKRSWILSLGLLCLAGAWFFWPRPVKLPTKPSAPPQSAVLPAATAPSASTAPNIPVAASTNAAKLGASGTNKFAFRLSNTARSLDQLTGDRHAILLENAFIDSSQPLNLSIPKNLQAQGDPGAYIVQARGPIGNAFRAMLARSGAQIVSYIPNDAYLVRASSGVANGLAANSSVQAVVPYEPYYKISSSMPVTIEQKTSAWTPIPARPAARTSLLGLAVGQKPLPAGTGLTLGLFSDSAAATVAQIEKLGGTILARDNSPFGPVVRVQPPADWVALARLPGVQLVEPSSRRVHANDLSRQTVGVAADTQVSSNYMNLTGSNVMVEVNDSGIDATHPDFQTGSGSPIRVFGDPANLFVNTLVDTDGHGTHVAGIIAGNGFESITVTNAQGSIMPATNGQFRGMAPLANLLSMGLFSDSDQQLQEAAALTNALISNNSWNYGGDSAYDLAAASYDAAVRDALPEVTGSQPVLFVFSAGDSGGGNSGGGGGNPDTILSPATAKNVITVGALEQLRNITNIVTDLNSNQSAVWQPETDTSFQVADYSSRGNVGIGTEGTYGRYKPDVVAPGSFVISTRSSQWDEQAYYNPTNYAFATFVDQTVASQMLNYYNVFVPGNAVGVVIQVVTNLLSPSPFPNLPIYVEQADLPTTNTFDFVTMNNEVSIPPDSGGAITGIQDVQNAGFWYAVGNNTNTSINYDIITEIITTNDLGNYFEVLSNLNNSLGGDPDSTVPPHYYRYESGTSMSAADVSGVLALMQDYFTNTLQATPSPALLKVMLINGARPDGNYDFQVQNSINFQGWGLVNLPGSLPLGMTTNLAATGESMLILDQNPNTALATGDSHTYLVNVSNPATALPLRITLAWTDPPGDPAAAIKLVNDLNLVVTNLSNPTNTIVYYGNDIPASSIYNTPENPTNPPVYDSINNVENVYLPPGVGSNFTVTVQGYRVNVNAVTAQTNNAVGNYAPNVVQDFALVISCGEGEVTNAFTVTDNPIISNPTSDQQITFVITTNTPLLNQFVGASTPLLGTNQLSLETNLVWSGTNGVVTVGMTNQWHFYVVTNNGVDSSGSSSDVTNAAFVTFLPDTLSIPRMGVFADSMADATRPEADIDLLVSTDPTLTNMNPVVISNCVNGVQVGASVAGTFNGASLGRGGTEFVVDSNSTPGQVYYVGVQSEDQMASEYGFISIFTSTPFSQPGPNGSQIVNGVPVLVNIPDGSTAHPGSGYVFGIALYPMQVERVVVTNVIAHQNFGDLIGTLTHGGQNGMSETTVLNNHDSFYNSSGIYTNIYDDSGWGDIAGARSSDGPGNLNGFIGQQGNGPWILNETDTSLTQTGSVQSFTMLIQPHNDLTKGINVTLGPLGWYYGYIDVPAWATNLSLIATNFTPNPQTVFMFVKLGSAPTLTNFDEMVALNIGTPPWNSISIGPPLTPGRYWVGLYNPTLTEQTDVYLLARLGLATPPGQTIFTSSGPAPILDDAVTYASMDVSPNQPLSSVDVGLRVDHQRVSDLVFHLISPSGTRCLLVENRGGATTEGMGQTLAITNVVPVSSSGGASPTTNVVNVLLANGTLTINYNFYQEPDQMWVFAQAPPISTAPIFDSGMVSGSGVFNIPYTGSTQLTIVMNPLGNPNPTTKWDYTVSSAQVYNTYLVLTEDTSKTITPIKFAPTPFHGSPIITTSTNTSSVTSYIGVTNSVVVTNVVTTTNMAATTEWHSSFEGVGYILAIGAGNLFDGGWHVDSGSIDALVASGVGVSTNIADEGTNFIDLDGAVPGTISTNIATVPGENYTLTFAYSKNPDGNVYSDGYPTASMEVLQNSNPLLNLTVTGNNNSWDYLEWSTTSVVFTATANITTLTFHSTDPSGDKYGVLLDCINLASGLNDGFENTPAGDYAYGFNPGFGGWTVTANQVSVVTDTNTAYQGSNLLALADGTISRILPTVPGQNYALTFAYRGPGAVSLWRGETNTLDAVDGNNGSLIMGANGYTNGEVGNAFSFNNSGAQAVDIPHSSNLSITNQVTIDFWMNANSMSPYQGLVTSDNYGISIDVGNPPTGAGIDFGINGTHTTANANGGGAQVSVGVWHHVAGTYDGTKLQLYIDGQPSGNPGLYTGSISPMPLGDFVSIGSEDGRENGTLKNRHFWGLIDEASIYNRALSPSEIKAIYNHDSAGKYNTNAPTIAQGLAEAQVTIGTNNQQAFFGNNAGWQIMTYSFTATQTNTPLQITGLEPGMLLDNFALTNLVVVTNVTYWTNYATNGFEGAAAGDYTPGQIFDGWAENNNQVTVITDTNLAIEGTNLLALANGQITRILPTVAGNTYQLSYAYRGPGAVSLWRGENNPNDSIDGNTGIPTSITYAAGEVGQAFVFNGSTSGIRVPASANLNVGINNSGFTLDAWVNPVAATVNNLSSLLEWNTGSGSGAAPIAAQFGFSGGFDGDIYANIMDTTLTPHSLSSPAGTMIGNTWQHVAVTFNMATKAAVIYRNGAVVAQSSLPGTYTPWTSVDFYLGVRPAGNFANHFNGMMDEAGIYNRPLSASEIKAIYNLGNTYGLPQFDPNAPTIAQGLAEAQVTLGGTNLGFYGNNTTWQTTNIIFTATSNGTPLQITGIEPGMLLDNFILTQQAVGTNFTITTNVSGGDVYYLPEQSLDTFAGENAQGQWQLEIQDDRAGAGLTNSLVSWQLRFNFATNANPIIALTNGWAVTNVIPPGGMEYYLVIVPPNADMATNILFNTTGPLNLWFNPTTLPVGANPPDYLILSSPTPVGKAILTTTSAPTNIVPGGTYYLGVQNPGAATVNYGIEVDFHLLNLPVLPPIGTQIINELTLLTVTNTATGGTLPLTYSVTMVVDTNAMIANGWPLNYATTNPSPVISANGIITWTPTEAQGPGFYTIQTVVTDSSVPSPLIATNSFNVIVNEVNTPPFFLGTPPNQAITAYTTLIVTNAAGDSDLPPNPLTYTLINPPLGMTIDTNGVISWTPTLTQALTTNVITTVVTDFNPWAPINQHLSATNTFTVSVSGVPGPFAFTEPATSVTGTSAQLNGMASPNGPPTMAWFEWGTSTAYGNQTPPASAGGFNVVYVSSPISSLVLNQPYHYRLVVSNAMNVVYGFDQIFDETGVVAWGGNYAYQTNVPAGLSNAVAIAGAYDHSLAVKNDGTVVTWGTNYLGQTNVPPGLSNVVAVAGGEYYSLALKNDGTVATWGGSILNQTNVPPGLNGVVTIAGGTYSSLALKNNGQVVAWGANFYGLTNTASILSNIVAVAGGGYHSLALKNDGTVFAWGDDSDGQTNIPAGLTNVVAIAGGSFHSLALRYDGTVVAWGDNSTGQTNVPAGLSNVVAVAAGGFHSLVLKNDGSLLAWGDDSEGQTNTAGLSNVVAISSGYFHNLALASAFNVNLTNTPPYFLATNLPPVTMDELTTLTVTNAAADSDLPPQTLTYTVSVVVDTNATTSNGWPLTYVTNYPPPVIDANGVITWTPSEAQGPGVYIITTVVTDNGAPPLSATNSFSVTVNEVNTAPYFLVTNPPNQTVSALSTLIVTNAAGDSDIPPNPLTYTLLNPPAGMAIDTNGVIAWTPTLAQSSNTYTVTTVVTDTNVYAPVNRSLSATNQFNITVTLPSLVNGVPQTNTLASGGLVFYLVNVPTNADFATNLLLFATGGPLNVWFTTNSPPTITNADDFLLITNATGGSAVLGTNSAPPLVPGSSYYLGVQNTNASAVTYGIEVNFHYLSSLASTGTITGLTITATNSGYLLQWQGPTNFQYEIQWTTNLLPAVVWNTVLDPVIHMTVTPTNGHFSWFDDGSLTGGLGHLKFYRVLGSLNLGPVGPGPATNTVLAGALSQAVVTVPAGALWASNVLLSATGPLNVWFNQTNPPVGNTNAGDFLMLSNATAGVFVLNSSSVPPLVPGASYYLGFQNPGASNVTFAFQVTFGLASTNAVSGFGITATNGGFRLTWYAPTNDLFQVRWTTNLLPVINWQTFTNLIAYTGPVTPTNSRFTFFDDGSQFPLGPVRFYQVVLVGTATNSPLPTNAVSVSSAFVTTNGHFQLQWSAPANYQFQVEWTTNLASPVVWFTNAANITSATTNFIFMDTNALTTGKFYRLIVYP